MSREHIMPKLIFHAHFSNREKFIYYEETYSEWTVFAVEQGSFHYDLGGSTGTCAFGDLLFCKPGVPVRRVVIAPLTFQFLRLRWENTTGGAAGSSPAIPDGKISIRNTDRLAYNYAELHKAGQLPLNTDGSIRNHYVQDICYTYWQEASELASISTPVRIMPSPLMKKAASAIRQRAFGPCSLKQIAEELDISADRLSRDFKSGYGVTPMQYLSSIRLDKAKMLLIETNLTLAQISECCGYETGFYLNKLFRKQLHITPAQFRSTHRV